MVVDLTTTIAAVAFAAFGTELARRRALVRGQRADLDATVHLAEAARRADIRRFVFISSIGVNGNQTHDVPFTESDPPTPVDYGSLEVWADKTRRVLEWKPGLSFDEGATRNIAWFRTRLNAIA